MAINRLYGDSAQAFRKFTDLDRVTRHQSAWCQRRVTKRRQFFIPVPNGGRPVNHLHVTGQVIQYQRNVEIAPIKWRVLPNPHYIHAVKGQRSFTARAKRFVVAIRYRYRASFGHHPIVIQSQSLGINIKNLVAPLLGGQHQEISGVLVGLNPLKRIHDKRMSHPVSIAPSSTF